MPTLYPTTRKLDVRLIINCEMTLIVSLQFDSEYDLDFYCE